MQSFSCLSVLSLLRCKQFHQTRFVFSLCIFFDTLSPIIMLQWRMAVFKRHNYFWRHTHFSRNHDHLDLLVRPNIFQPNGVLIESMVIYHGTKSQNTPKTHIQDDGRFSTHLSNEKILLQWNTSCYLGILILAYEIIPPKKLGRISSPKNSQNNKPRAPFFIAHLPSLKLT